MTSRALLSFLALAGCASTQTYQARRVARGELTLRYTDRFEMTAGHELLASGYRWDGLADYVRCVPAAQRLALGAERDGHTATAFTWLGVGLAAISVGGFAGVGVENGKYTPAFIGAGLAVAVAGAVFAGLSRSYKNYANGQAIDAMNFYNDSVGGLGASCADLRYPPSVALPAPPPAVEAPHENAGVAPKP